jgi:hypothetical protein
LGNKPQHVNGIFVGQLEQFDFRRFSDVSDFIDVCYVIVIIGINIVIDFIDVCYVIVIIGINIVIDFIDVCYVTVIIDLSDVIVVKVVIDDDRDGVNSSLK